VTRPCVRCGDFPRDGEAFLCVACKAEVAAVEREMVEAWKAVFPETDPNVPRRWLMEHGGWAGGWNHATRARPPISESELRMAWGDR
jgi:hypothetical protein